MFRFMAFPALLVLSAALLAPARANAEDHDYRYGDRGYYGYDYDRHAGHEYREHRRHEEREWRERERREHEWREHEYREHRWRNRYSNGYYDQFGYWHPYSYRY